MGYLEMSDLQELFGMYTLLSQLSVTWLILFTANVFEISPGDVLL